MRSRFLIAAFLVSGLLLPVSAANAMLSDELGIVIEHPAGKYYVPLVGAVDGPVQIPVQENGLWALQISSVRIDGGIRVIFHALLDEATYQLATSQDLHFEAEGARIELVALESYGLEGWVLELGIKPGGDPGAQCACCGCGNLYCCPNEGQCMSCGSCGDCCCTGGGTGKPFQDN